MRLSTLRATRHEISGHPWLFRFRRLACLSRMARQHVARSSSCSSVRSLDVSVTMLVDPVVQRQQRSAPADHVPVESQPPRCLYAPPEGCPMRPTSSWIVSGITARVPSWRPLVVTADANLCPTSAGVCTYLPAPVRRLPLAGTRNCGRPGGQSRQVVQKRPGGAADSLGLGVDFLGRSRYLGRHVMFRSVPGIKMLNGASKSRLAPHQMRYVTQYFM